MQSSDIDMMALRNLEGEADDLLTELSMPLNHVSEQSLERLDACASAAAKIAYGSNHPELLSEQMSTLITWTDHLDDPLWVGRFKEALKNRPLVSPWKE